jgi:O-antigen ligase
LVGVENFKQPVRHIKSVTPAAWVMLNMSSTFNQTIHMGFVLSVFYFVIYYLTPTTIFGPLAAAHIELIIAALALLVSLPALIKSFILKTPQTLALIGMAIAVFLSVFIGMHWPGGALHVFLLYIPNAFAYFLVGLHCNTKRRLQVVVLALLFVCLFVIGHGAAELFAGARTSPLLQQGLTESPYLLTQKSDTGALFYRLRGLGEINDPNDFAQLTVCVIPLLFIFWRSKKLVPNLLLVGLPACALLIGVFLTHSRGALIALIAITVLAVRRRIGTLPALAVAAGLFIAASALHFTGGREISANAGSDRSGLWGVGLQMVKSHPLFGVGFGNFADTAGLTAHNSVVVCAAELGLSGLFFWALFLFPTIRNALSIASSAKVTEAGPMVPEQEPFPGQSRNIEVLDKAEINSLGRLLILSLTGFLVAALFLSRAYVLTLFLLGGMAEVVFQMALDRGMVSPRLPLKRVLPYAGILAVGLVLFMYIMVRILNVMR